MRTGNREKLVFKAVFHACAFAALGLYDLITLIIIALIFSFLIGLQFRIRNRALAWQKGTI